MLCTRVWGLLRGVAVADFCRCHLPLDPPLQPAVRCWWPRREAEPGSHVRVVAMCGVDPRFLRRVREPGGWRSRGHGANHPDCTPPVPWSDVGSCWAGAEHAVVDATDTLVPAAVEGLAEGRGGAALPTADPPDVDRLSWAGLRGAAAGFAQRGWPVLPGTYPGVGEHRWSGRAAAVGLRPVDDDWAALHTVRAAQVDRWWAAAPYSVLLACGHGVDCLELPSSPTAPLLPGLLRGAGVPAPAMLTPVGTVVLFVRTIPRPPGVVPSVSVRSLGSWVALPPTRTAGAPRGGDAYRWLRHGSPESLDWRLPDPAAVCEVIVAFGRRGHSRRPPRS